MAKAQAHLTPPAEPPALESLAREFGLEPHEALHLAWHHMRMFTQWSDWVGSDLPKRDRDFVDLQVRGCLINPVFAKLWNLLRPGIVSLGGDTGGEVIALIDRVSASLTPT